MRNSNRKNMVEYNTDLGIWPIFKPLQTVGKGLFNVAKAPFQLVGKAVSSITEPGSWGAKTPKEMPTTPAGEPLIIEPGKQTKPSGTQSQFEFQNLFESLEAPLKMFVKGYSNVKQAEYMSDIAKARAEAVKAQRARQQAYQRAVTQERREEKEQKGIIREEAFKDLAPYLIPIAVGGVIILVLATGGKK